MSKTAVNLFKQQFAQAHGWLEGVMSDVSQELAEEQINPKAMKIGAQYIHIVLGLDHLVLGKFAGKKPFSIGDWSDKKGFSPDAPEQGDHFEWSTKVSFEIEKVRDYCEAVHQAVEEYLDTITDEDLIKTEDLSDWGMSSEEPRSSILTMALLNTAAHAGEIANMKGLKGLKGYPW